MFNLLKNLKCPSTFSDSTRLTIMQTPINFVESIDAYFVSTKDQCLKLAAGHMLDHKVSAIIMVKNR